MGIDLQIVTRFSKPTLYNMLFKMAFLKHFEEQGKTTKRCYFLIYELYVTVSHRSIYYFRGKVSKYL